MRRIALLGLALTLSGCGYNTWWNPPLTGGYNPNAPLTESQNVLRARGTATDLAPLTTEPGDIWPGPPPPTPTLKELEQQLGQTPLGSEEPAGNPARGGVRGSPNPAVGSSTPPGSVQPPTGVQPAPNYRAYAAPPAAPPAPNPAGQTYQTKGGPAVTTGGGPGYQTITLPGGGTGIVIPNGNGSSTIIRSDGKMETVPTPR